MLYCYKIRLKRPFIIYRGGVGWQWFIHHWNEKKRGLLLVLIQKVHSPLPKRKFRFNSNNMIVTVYIVEQSINACEVHSCVLFLFSFPVSPSSKFPPPQYSESECENDGERDQLEPVIQFPRQIRSGRIIGTMFSQYRSWLFSILTRNVPLTCGCFCVRGHIHHKIFSKHHAKPATFDHNTGNSVLYSFRTVRGFFYVPQNC